MKEHLSLLAIVMLSICLVGLVFDWIAPAGLVHAAGPPEKEAVPLTLSAQPVAFVVTGLVCVFFGIMAAFPLLIDDPALRRGAGIYLMHGPIPLQAPDFAAVTPMIAGDS